MAYPTELSTSACALVYALGSGQTLGKVASEVWETTVAMLIRVFEFSTRDVCDISSAGGQETEGKVELDGHQRIQLTDGDHVDAGSDVTRA